MADKWTRDDERRYREMTERRDAFELEHGGALRALCAERLVVGTGDDDGDADEAERLYKALRRSADNFIDALAPFDSGVRCAPETA